jgi:hypothetical protein
MSLARDLLLTAIPAMYTVPVIVHETANVTTSPVQAMVRRHVDSTSLDDFISLK